MSDKNKNIQWFANYEHDIITDNETVQLNGCSCIKFENIGTANAKMGNVPLMPTDLPREYKNEPGTLIKGNFAISFTGGENKLILVTKTFYTKNEFYY